MKLSQSACDRLTLAAFLILISVVALLCFELSQAWRNERFLDAELNKYTTTYNPTNK